MKWKTGNESSDSGSKNTTSGAFTFGDQLLLVLVRNEAPPQSKGLVGSGRNLKNKNRVRVHSNNTRHFFWRILEKKPRAI